MKKGVISSSVLKNRLGKQTSGWEEAFSGDWHKQNMEVSDGILSHLA